MYCVLEIAGRFLLILSDALWHRSRSIFPLAFLTLHDLPFEFRLDLFLPLTSWAAYVHPKQEMYFARPLPLCRSLA